MKLFAIPALFVLLSFGPVQIREGTANPDTGSIEGVVRSQSTSRPVAGANVFLIAAPGPGGSLARASDPITRIADSAVTDSEGRFHFDRVSARSYNLRVGQRGFVPAVYGALSYYGQGKTIDLKPSEQREDIVVALIPTGALSGRILDSANVPIEGVPVLLRTDAFDADGRKILAQLRQTSTDRRGLYEFDEVIPGSYYVAAGPLEFPLYYPDAPGPSEAQLLQVVPGGDLHADNMQITARRAPGYRIRGRIIGMNGTPPSDVQIGIQYREERMIDYTNARYNPSDGTFELRDLLSGVYSVRVWGLATVDDGAGGKQWQGGAQREIRVIDSDVENIVFAPTSRASLLGIASMDNEMFEHELEGWLNRLDISIRLDQAHLDRPFPFKQRIKHPTFSLTDIEQGDYIVSLEGLFPGLYLKDVRIGADSILGKPFHLSGSVSDSLKVVIGGNPGGIEGTVLGPDGEPLEHAQLALVPDEHLLLDRYQTADSGSAGRFFFDRVPPGSYRVFAFEELAPHHYFDHEMLSRLEPFAAAVKISEGTTAQVRVKIIPR